MRVLVVFLLLLPATAGCLQQETNPTQMQEPPPHPLEASSFTWTPFFPEAGEPVRFIPNVRSNEPGDEVVALKWDLGGTLNTDNRPLHVFQAAGDHDVRLTIQTRIGGQHILEETVEVLPGRGTAPQSTPTGAPAEPTAPPEPLWSINQSTVHFAFRFDEAVESVHWDFGDGTTSNEHRPTHVYASVGDFDVTLRVLAPSGIHETRFNVTVESVPFLPHVIVAVPDSGVNPYHAVYHRPQLTAHPCTYIRDYPCDIPALELTLDASSWQEAFQADKEKWEAIRPGDRFWIPGTNLITVMCQEPYTGSTATSGVGATGVDHCILDDSSMHGTGSTSSVLSENPEALLIFEEGNSNHDSLIDGTFPIDVINFSWGAAVPLAGTNLLQTDYAPFFVAASGNEGAFPVLLDGQKSHPSVINVGGADGASQTEPGYSSWKTADFVSEYCRPTAQTRSLTETRERYCGTSFPAPTLAGALSKIILGLRKSSGYTGSIQDGMVDPLLGISKADVRDALNRTATYEATGPFPADPEYVPLVESAPFYQYGWGYFAREQVPAALECILSDVCPDKPDAAVAYMDALWTYRETTATE